MILYEAQISIATLKFTQKKGRGAALQIDDNNQCYVLLLGDVEKSRMPVCNTRFHLVKEFQLA
jgi:hypothetical protein